MNRQPRSSVMSRGPASIPLFPLSRIRELPVAFYREFLTGSCCCCSASDWHSRSPRLPLYLKPPTLRIDGRNVLTRLHSGSLQAQLFASTCYAATIQCLRHGPYSTQ